MHDTPHPTGIDSPDIPAEHGAMMRRAALASLLVAGSLVIIKFAAWVTTDSVSMLTTLMDSLLDILASTVNFLAIRYALQPPDHEHRFGHGKAEDLASLAQGTLIAGSGIYIIAEALHLLIHPTPLAHGTLGIGVMLVSIVLTGILVTYQRHVSRITGSTAITADSVHYLMDFLTNIAVIVALILSGYLGLHIADPIFALLIAAYILYNAWHVGHTAFQHLMDREFSDEQRAEIEKIILAHPRAQGFHQLKTRRSGINRFIQFHLDLDENLPLKEAHDIAEEVEQQLLTRFPNAEIIIHQDPVEAK